MQRFKPSSLRKVVVPLNHGFHNHSYKIKLLQNRKSKPTISQTFRKDTFKKAPITRDNVMFHNCNSLKTRSYCNVHSLQNKNGIFRSIKKIPLNGYFMYSSSSSVTVPIIPSSFIRSNRKFIPLHSNLGSISYLSSWNQNNKNRVPNPKSSRLGLLSSGLFGSALLLGGKTKYLLGALKLTKFASLGSMLMTVGTYSIFFGVPYAVGMVSLILVHESGHALGEFFRPT